MPPRISRSNVQPAVGKQNPRNKNRKRTLDAYSIASHSIKNEKAGRSHRLGEVVDDEPRNKKRRVDDDDESDDDESEDGASRSQKPRARAPNGDDVEEGSDSDGNHWTIGMQEDDEDSDIDSDEAFGESDEEKFEGFTFRGSTTTSKEKSKKSHAVRRAHQDNDIDLDEDDENSEVLDDDDDDDSLGEEAVDLATMLDDSGDDMEIPGLNKESGRKRSGGTSDDEDQDDDDDDDDDSGFDSDEASSEDDEESIEDQGLDKERVARLRDKLESLDEAPAIKVPLPTNEIISIEDLLADLDPAAKAQFAAPLKSKNNKSQAPATLSVPLPKRQQDRIDREVASKKAKEELDRWQDTVIHNRRAEHLSFPLQNPNDTQPQGKDKFLRNVAQNELEENIQRIMEESGMVTKQNHRPDDNLDDALIKSEELATKDMPIEEVLRRRAELRRTRELLFREEIKAKRIAKIKSKSYRRVHRKERERLAEKERELLGPESLGLPLDEDERETLDRKRAEARMNTKHHDSKWAKSLKATNRTVWDESARSGAHEQARRVEDLKRRIAGKDASRSDDDEVSSDDVSEDEDDGNGATLRQLDNLENGIKANGKSRIGDMKFMQAADARRKAQNDQDIASLRKSLAFGGDDNASENEPDEKELGRAIFGPKAHKSTLPSNRTKLKQPILEEGVLDDEYNDHNEAKIHVATGGTQSRSSRMGIAAQRSQKTSSQMTMQQAANKSRLAAEESGISWLTDSSAKVSKKDRKRDRMEGVGDTLIVSRLEQKDSTGHNANLPSKNQQNEENVSAAQSNGWTTITVKQQAISADDRASAEIEDENPILSAEQQKAAYQARAFAGDDVKNAFDLEKEAAVASEDEKEVSTHLPGWGSWTGNGLSKTIRKANTKQKHNPLFKTKLPGGIKAENRKDKALNNVIISEKQDRKGKKYLAPMLPHEFERKEQYERSLRVPIGPEWTTKETFQRSTKPRVMVKQGIVAPMQRPLL